MFSQLTQKHNIYHQFGNNCQWVLRLWSRAALITSLNLSIFYAAALSASAQEIQWLTVLDTAHPSAMEAEPQPAMVGFNTINRRGDAITFDALVDGQYVRYSGNCRTHVLYRLSIGFVNHAFQPYNIRVYPSERWFAVNAFQRKILTTACSI